MRQAHDAPVSYSILHVAQPFDAGVPRVASALVADQVRRGWDVSVASPAGGDLHAAAERAGARWRAWQATRAPGPATLSETRRLAKIVAAVDPQLVHLHSAKAGVAGRLAIRRARPTVFQPHAWSFDAAEGALRRATVAWERFGARWADAIVAVSADERRHGEDAGVEARRWAEIPNGVDLERYPVATAADRAAARRGFGVAEDAPLVVVVGRLARQKGQDTLLRAWTDVVARVPAAQLVLVGDGPDLASLEAMAAASVTFAGDAADVGDWLAAATVTAIPSRWEAGLSLVAMEAMARGRSVVATDVAGMKAGIGTDCGAVVPVDAERPLADALVERLADPALADLEGAAGRARVEERYDVRVACARMAELYEELLADRSRAAQRL